MITINLIQDIPTPHNNVLISEFFNCEDVKIKLWYAQLQMPNKYPNNSDDLNNYGISTVYGVTLNFRFLWYCLSHPKEKYVLVGWSNINTLLLHLIFFILRRPFNHWTDLPNPDLTGKSKFQKLLRWLAYKQLFYSNCRIFGVGEITLAYFRTRKFSDKKLINLPIFISIDDNLYDYKKKLTDLRERYSVPPDGFLLSAGSRLISEKGYDLLISSFAKLPGDILNRTRLIIVGNGPEYESLKNQISTLSLEKFIQIENWLCIDDFKLLIANSDIFIHPARFDAYGGTIYAMSLGVPVIGSLNAGAALDRIVNGFNGFLYDPLDLEFLSHKIISILNDINLRKRIGESARDTALEWPPKRGVDILIKHSI
jgi:glycosyltransferase involved in cell wall biosynthesis